MTAMKLGPINRPPMSNITMSVAVRLPMDEMQRVLTPAQIDAVMRGVSLVIQAGQK